MADEEDDTPLLGWEEALSRKATPLSLGSWTIMAANVEGRDKFFKMIQFGARYMKWFHLSRGDDTSATAWNGLFMSVQEGRKSVRWLKGLNKVNQVFDEVPKAESVLRKLLLICQHLGLGMHWHFDYLAHSHRAKFLNFGDETYARIFRMPGFAWSVSNVAQILLGFMNLRRATVGIHEVKAQLSALLARGAGVMGSCAAAGDDDAEERQALESKLKSLIVMRFQGWLLALKGVCDLMTSCAMNGPRLRKRFPKTFGWLNDGTVGVAGFISGMIVCFNYFPTKAKVAEVGWKDGKQTLQRERNVAGIVFAIMQCSTMLEGFRPRPQLATS